MLLSDILIYIIAFLDFPNDYNIEVVISLIKTKICKKKKEDKNLDKEDSCWIEYPSEKLFYFNSLHAVKFFMLTLSSVDFFKIKPFQKVLSRTLSERQMI